MYTLMTVDDSMTIRNQIERFSLKGGGLFTVVAKAKNGAQAVEYFCRHRPDVVTMDLTMPEMDGLECIQKLKQIDPNVKILVISALTDKQTCLKAMKLGAKGFVSKPIEEDKLLEAMNRLVAGNVIKRNRWWRK